MRRDCFVFFPHLFPRVGSHQRPLHTVTLVFTSLGRQIIPSLQLVQVQYLVLFDLVFCSAHAQTPRPSLCSAIGSTAFTCSPAIPASPWEKNKRDRSALSQPNLFTCLPSSSSSAFVTINLLPRLQSSCLCFCVGQLQNVTLSRTLHLVETLSCPQVIWADRGIWWV